MDDEIVWLNEQRTYAVLVSRHAHYSVVRYAVEGHTIELEVLNDDYEYWESRAIEHESD